MNGTALIAADGGAGAAIALLVVLAVVVFGYQSILRKGIRERVMVSSLSADQLRAIFASKVATLGWKVVDNDNPVVAQSPVLAGRRQQISLTMTREGNRIRCRIAPTRVWVKFGGVPYKAHTLRMRLNAFERAVLNSGGVAAVGAARPAVRPVAGPMAAPTAAPAAAVASSAAPAPAAAPTPAVTPVAAALPVVAAPVAPAPSRQAGQWVADPFGRHQLRYHDGVDWTSNVSDAGVVGIDPPEWRVAGAAEPSAQQAITEPPVLSGDAHDGKTMSRAALAAMSASSIEIRLDTGAVHRLTGRTLLGRNPAPGEHELGVQCLPIDDPSLSVSKTHLLVEVADGVVTVQDRASVNGTSVELRDGAIHDLAAGDSIVVPVGSVVRFGDRSFTVERT